MFQVMNQVLEKQFYCLDINPVNNSLFEKFPDKWLSKLLLSANIFRVELSLKAFINEQPNAQN